MMRGKFITVEGIEGTGKSTNIEFLTLLIKSNGFDVICTREPGGTPMAEKIRQLLLDHGQEPLPEIAELLLFFAARSLHLRNTIVPALNAGKWVVCDRFTDASRAYQGSGREISPDRIERLAEWVQEGLEPDMTILLDAPAEVGLQRAAKRGNADRMDSQELSFYRRVREGYLALADNHPGRFSVVDASQPLTQVQESIATAVGRFFNH
ncbi:MAG: dTMP kinase [Proteobacteria bacterium]|jgi:dTMP kinase|nr:dTMP kinase [Pseudomonadota bacterium]MDA0993845.1 dTMP kinase [Pseudomonadota bacterium]